MANYEYMPVMAGVNAYFDARIYVKSDKWTSMVGDIIISLFNPVISTDGVEVVGSQTSYGKFTKPYVSGSSRTWYFVFKNISGVYRNWRTIIGNEVTTTNHQCSTIAMDGSGYLKFTRPDIVPSGYKCSDWHVVAWVSNGSNRTTRLFIDGVLCGSVGNMQGWADDTYLSRGPGWWYSDNNTQYRFVAIADTAHSNEDVISNSTFLRDYFITNYDPNIRPAYLKYLVRDNDTIYTVSDGALTEVTGTINSELFMTSGVDTIPDGALLTTLSAPEVLCWTDAETLPTLTATVTATPIGQYISKVIDMSDESISGINNVTVECAGTPWFSCSFDGGTTWKEYSGGAWIDVESYGMTEETIEAITSDEWNSVTDGLSSFVMRVLLRSSSDSLTSLKVEFLNET